MKLRKFLLSTLAASAVALTSATASADIVLFDFENDGDAATPFGMAIDVGPGFTGTQAGITFTATATSNVAGTTVPNGGNGFGVNSSVPGDSNIGLDPGEILTLTVTFDETAFEKVQFTNIDVGNIGGAADGANITLTDGTNFDFHDDATAPAGLVFSGGTPDIVSVADGNVIDISSGQTFVFQTPTGQAVNQDFRLQRISLHVKDAVAVPEPSSLALLGLLGGVVAIRRRR